MKINNCVTMQQTVTVGPVTFRQFVFGEHRKMLTFAIPGMILLFTLYKIIYPYPDMYFDSWHYILLARNSQFMTVWPIGYSLFLRTLHFITPNPLLLVIVQYLLLQVCSFYLLFTLFYAFHPPQWVRITLVAFLAVNPLYLYLANLVSSDILFTALSLLWFTILIRMLLDAKYWHVLLQGPLLAYLFMIRYQAAWYPLLMLLVLWLSEVTWLWKIISAGIAFFLIGWIVQTTKRSNERAYGIHQFSAQSGWILANNAMYMYPHIAHDSTFFKGDTLQHIDNRVQRILAAQGLFRKNYTPVDGPKFMIGDGVMWYYLLEEIGKNPGKNEFWVYNHYGPHWQQYGWQLIKAHPVQYTRYFLLPNTLGYLCPMLEQFDTYYMGWTELPPYVQEWFRLKETKVYTRWTRGSFYSLWLFQPLFALINVCLLFMGVNIIRQKKYLLFHPVQRMIAGLLALTFSGNACFLIITAPVMLRYQATAIAVGVILVILFWPLYAYQPPKAVAAEA